MALAATPSLYMSSSTSATAATELNKQWISPIEMDWESYEKKLVAFWNAIDEFVSNSKSSIASQTANHAEHLRELKVEKQEMEKKIAEEREKERKMLGVLEQERTNLSDLSSSLARLNLSLGKLRDTNTHLEGDMNKLKREVGTSRGEKERQTNVLENERKKDEPELSRLERLLGWRVEGVKDNRLLMTFTQIDPSDPDKQYSLLIDVSQSTYSVPNSYPPLPIVNDLVAQLNKDKQLFQFVKRVRKAFRQTVSERDEGSGDQEMRQMFMGVGGPGGSGPAASSSLSSSVGAGASPA